MKKQNWYVIIKILYKLEEKNKIPKIRLPEKKRFVEWLDKDLIKLFFCEPQNIINRFLSEKNYNEINGSIISKIDYTHLKNLFNLNLDSSLSELYETERKEWYKTSVYAFLFKIYSDFLFSTNYIKLKEKESLFNHLEVWKNKKKFKNSIFQYIYEWEDEVIYFDNEWEVFVNFWFEKYALKYFNKLKLWKSNFLPDILFTDFDNINKRSAIIQNYNYNKKINYYLFGRAIINNDWSETEKLFCQVEDVFDSWQKVAKIEDKNLRFYLEKELKDIT